MQALGIADHRYRGLGKGNRADLQPGRCQVVFDILQTQCLPGHHWLGSLIQAHIQMADFSLTTKGARQGVILPIHIQMTVKLQPAVNQHQIGGFLQIRLKPGQREVGAGQGRFQIERVRSYLTSGRDPAVACQCGGHSIADRFLRVITQAAQFQTDVLKHQVGGGGRHLVLPPYLAVAQLDRLE